MVRQPETRYAEGPEGKFWSGPHLIFHAAHQHTDSALSSPMVLAPVLLIFVLRAEEMT